MTNEEWIEAQLAKAPPVSEATKRIITALIARRPPPSPPEPVEREADDYEDWRPADYYDDWPFEDRVSVELTPEFKVAVARCAIFDHRRPLTDAEVERVAAMSNEWFEELLDSAIRQSSSDRL